MSMRSVFFVVSLALSAPLLAAEEEEVDDPLEGNVKLGYLATTGNTETTDVGLSLKLKHQDGQWTQAGEFAADYGFRAEGSRFSIHLNGSSGSLRQDRGRTRSCSCRGPKCSVTPQARPK